MGLRKPQQQQNHVVELISRESVEENHSSLQQSILRLMNAMASVKSGRDYLGMLCKYKRGIHKLHTFTEF